MKKELTISELYLHARAVHDAAQERELMVMFDLNQSDIFDMTVLRKLPNYECETLWMQRVDDISKNILDGFILIGQAIGFIEGYDKAKEVEFGPLEKVTVEA